jgi:type IV pilus assembly protein PilM
VTRLITLPKMSAAQTRDAISLQLNQYVPFPPGDTLFDYKVLREIKEEDTLSQEILLVATQRTQMQPVMVALKKAGLNVTGIKITTLTGFNLFEDYYRDAEQAIAFVDVRDSVTDIAFVAENFFRLSRSIEFGNMLVTDKIRQKIGGTYEDVEEYLALNKIDLQETYSPVVTVEEPEEVSDDVSPLERKAKSTGGGGEENKEKGIRDSVLRVLGAFVNELMRSIRFFESQQKRRSRVGKLVIFGNISYLGNLADYISEQTGLDTVVIDSTPSVIESGLSGIDMQVYENNEAKAIIPLSLAYEGVKARRLELNLVPRETVVRKKAFSFARYVIAAYIVMLALMAVWYIGKDREAQDVKAEVQEWDRKINQITPFYNDTEGIKTQINEIAWIPVLEELGLIQIPSTWIDEYSMDANGGAVAFHGFGLKTSNIQRFLAICYYSNVFKWSKLDLSVATDATGGNEDQMGGGDTGSSSSGAMGMEIPIPDMMGNDSPNDVKGPLANSGAKPMYGLPDVPRGTRDIESFWQGRTVVVPILYEFELEMTIAPEVLDTSAAAFEGLDTLTV